jgi:hypothetical protein
LAGEPQLFALTSTLRGRRKRTSEKQKDTHHYGNYRILWGHIALQVRIIDPDTYLHHFKR